ncbi:MAG: Tim44-like domain-containing protein [Myxococcota bacterium]|nr:Tim44-like domain-containing protein [Myxococcota bacterium]
MASLGKRNPAFDRFTLKDRVTDCFQRVHSAWRREDLAEASAWMTDWYWQNQQLAHLDAWEREGLINHCKVKKLRGMRPLALSCRNFDGQGGGSRVVVAINASMDYLAERATGRVVEGKRGFKDVETVWTFVLEDGAWRVNNIEEDSMTLAYARLATDVEELLHPSDASPGPVRVPRPPPSGRLH